MREIIAHIRSDWNRVNRKAASPTVGETADLDFRTDCYLALTMVQESTSVKAVPSAFAFFVASRAVSASTKTVFMSCRDLPFSVMK